MDLKKLTRMQAERLVAETTDEAVLRHLAGHANKHVAQKVAFKLASPEDRLCAAGVSRLSAFLRGVSS